MSTEVELSRSHYVGWGESIGMLRSHAVKLTVHGDHRASFPCPICQRKVNLTNSFVGFHARTCSGCGQEWHDGTDDLQFISTADVEPGMIFARLVWCYGA